MEAVLLEPYGQSDLANLPKSITRCCNAQSVRPRASLVFGGVARQGFAFRGLAFELTCTLWRADFGLQ